MHFDFCGSFVRDVRIHAIRQAQWWEGEESEDTSAAHKFNESHDKSTQCVLETGENQTCLHKTSSGSWEV